MKKKLPFILVFLLLVAPITTYGTMTLFKPDKIAPSILYFDGHKDYRMWQGVASDGKYIYVFSDRDENFELENIISVYTLDGKFVKEKTEAYTQKSTTDKFMSFGDGRVINGYLYVTVYDFNGGSAQLPVNERESRVVKYNTSSLNVVAEYDIGEGTAESIDFYDDSFWVVYHDINEIRRFDEQFNLTETYPLSANFESEGGYQGIIFEDGELYANLHGSNQFGQEYAFGLDHYHFDGTKFTFVERIKPPTYGSGQGIDSVGDTYLWVDRPANRIILTTSLNTGNLRTLGGEVVEQEIIKPALLNGWADFDTEYDRSPRFWKDQNGIVHLEGIMKGGTLQKAAFVLPEGYRPMTSKNFPAVSNDKFARIAIIGSSSNSGSDRAGEVIVMIGDQEWVSLDGISFLAE